MKEFKNLLGMNLIKYSSKFLAYIKNILVIEAHQQMFKIVAQNYLVSTPGNSRKYFGARKVLQLDISFASF